MLCLTVGPRRLHDASAPSEELHHLMIGWYRRGFGPAKGALLLILAVAVAGSLVIAGIGLQLALARGVVEGSVGEIEALLASSRCGKSANTSSIQYDARRK
jgi:hypothetical protein